jgi:DNA topoisomerase-1
MENQLDEIAEGKQQWIPVIREFYGPFHENLVLKDKEVEKHREELAEKCPECGQILLIKFGRFGKFIACSNYPTCKYTRPMEDEQKEIDENAGEICDKCGKPMVVKRGKWGSFLGCSGYPDCKNLKKIQKGTGVTCPMCGEGEMLQRQSKRGVFYSCSKYPKCKYLLNGKPLNEQCPTCKKPLMEMKNGVIKCSGKECDYTKE